MKSRFKKRKDKIKGSLYLHKNNHLKDEVHWANYLMNYNIDRLNRKTLITSKYLQLDESLEKLLSRLFSKKYED